jgi:hypothetical protein
MDFGTICHTLEKGKKYENSRDVFQDVQLIWENCFKYNHKGDPILDLMKRVKKNFTKYWTAADLYYEPPKRSSGEFLILFILDLLLQNAYLYKRLCLSIFNLKQHFASKLKHSLSPWTAPYMLCYLKTITHSILVSKRTRKKDKK